MHFLRPYLLLLFVPFVLLLLLLMRRGRHVNIWHQICSKELMPYVLEKKSVKKTAFSLLTLATLSLLIFALAGPTWNQVAQPLIKPQSGLVIILDLSDSMNAQDIKPSRLQRALYKIRDLLNLRHDGQTALIVFSGAPFTVTPLTDDVATIQSLLPVLDTKIMPTGGQKVSHAIAKATGLLSQASVKDGFILLATAELSNDDLEKSTELAHQHGIKISVLGVGTEVSTPIPKQDGGFIKDGGGAVMMTTLSKKNLSQLANATQGVYATISLDDSDINQIAAALSSQNGMTSHEQTDLHTYQWLDQGYLFVLLALPLVSLFFRRGVLAIMVLIMPQALSAFSFSNLWQTPDQQAEQLFHQKEYHQARDLFQNQEWQAATNYQLGDYEAAANLYQHDLSAEGWYNYGTAKGKLGDFKGAIEAYNQTLEKQPDHEDALYNKKIIEELLKQQEKNQSDKQGDQESDQQKDNQKQSEQENQKNQNGENQEGQQQEGSDQDAQQDSNKEQKPSSDESNASKQNSKQKRSKGKQSEEQSGSQNQPSEADEKQQEELRQQFQDKLKKESQEMQEPPIEQQHVQGESPTKKEDAQQHIDARWLQSVQDDPGGLLRRKFLQQHRKTRQ